MIRIFLLAVVLLFSNPIFSAADDWGKTGHRVTGHIAQQHLTKRARKAITALLDGASLAAVSTFADEIKSDSQFKKYGPWHYVNVPFDSTYEQHPKSERGDLMQGIDTCIAVLQDENSRREDKIFHLKLLVHFIGDLHQPLHTGIAEDKGGNDFQVQWFGKGTNLHRVWDTQMIAQYGMSYTEIAMNMEGLTKKQRKAIQTGTHYDWMKESRGLIKDIYSKTKKGEKLGYRYMYDYFDKVEDQLQKGGLRLAAMLNQIFD